MLNSVIWARSRFEYENMELGESDCAETTRAFGPILKRCSPCEWRKQCEAERSLFRTTKRRAKLRIGHDKRADRHSGDDRAEWMKCLNERNKSNQSKSPLQIILSELLSLHSLAARMKELKVEMGTYQPQSMKLELLLRIFSCRPSLHSLRAWHSGRKWPRGTPVTAVSCHVSEWARETSITLQYQK